MSVTKIISTKPMYNDGRATFYDPYPVSGSNSYNIEDGPNMPVQSGFRVNPDIFTPSGVLTL